MVFMPLHSTSLPVQHGIRANLTQILHQLLQVFLVGLTIGMTRTVVPGLAETEFGLGGQQFFLLTTFVVTFGAVKAVMNLFAGRFSDRFGRKRVLVAGWMAAIPIPFLLLYAPNWGWVVAATALLGVNQGLCWSMTLNSKLDMTHLSQKGLVNGMNEFSGYAAVALAGVVTAWLVEVYGARQGLALFGTVVILAGLILAILMIKETRPWALAHAPAVSATSTPPPSLGQAFLYASWQNRNLLALNQAGLVEKFTDALVWIILPVWFVSQHLTLVQASSIIGVYALVWGASQLITGPASDRFGRKPLDCRRHVAVRHRCIAAGTDAYRMAVDAGSRINRFRHGNALPHVGRSGRGCQPARATRHITRRLPFLARFRLCRRCAEHGLAGTMGARLGRNLLAGRGGNAAVRRVGCAGIQQGLTPSPP